MSWSNSGWNNAGWGRIAAAGGGGGATSTYVNFSDIGLDGFPYPTQAIDMTGAATNDLLIIDLTVSRTSDDPLTATGIPTLNGSGGALTQVSRDIWTVGTNILVAQSYLLYKVLTAADISNGTMNIPSYGGFETFHWATSIWHGGTTVTKKSFVTSATSSATTLAFAGYTQTSGTAVVMAEHANDQIGGTYVPASPFVNKLANQGVGLGVANHYGFYIASSPSNLSTGTYTFNGFSDVNPTDATHKGQAGYLLEIS